MISVSVGTSLDGFLARLNGDVDFLLPYGVEPHDFTAFTADIDAVVMGRRTFEAAAKLASWPYGATRVVVLSHVADLIDVAKRPSVEQMAGTPKHILSLLAATGAHRIFIEGGATIREFLRAGFVERLVITRVPVLIGSGIPLFGDIAGDIRLRHMMSRYYETGIVSSEYRFG